MHKNVLLCTRIFLSVSFVTITVVSAIFTCRALQFCERRLSPLTLPHFSTLLDIIRVRFRLTRLLHSSVHRMVRDLQLAPKSGFCIFWRSGSFFKLNSSISAFPHLLFSRLSSDIFASCHLFHNFCSSYNLFPSGYTLLFWLDPPPLGHGWRFGSLPRSVYVV